MTTAAWMRQFVTSHPEYKQDSYLTEGIAHDLLVACNEIGKGTRACPEILGTHVIEEISTRDAYETPMMGKISATERSSLIQNLVQRAVARCKQVEERKSVILSERDPAAGSSGSGSGSGGVSGGNLVRGGLPLPAGCTPSPTPRGSADVPFKRSMSMV